MHPTHTAAIVVAAIAAPNVANATSTVTADPVMVADVVKMTTDLVNAVTYGSAAGARQLTPEQQNTLKFGLQQLTQKALASGMTWRQFMYALAKGVGKSEAGILGRAVGNYVSVIAYEYWAAAGAAWNSVTLPLPLIYIMYGPGGCPGCNPGMVINYEDIYLPYPDSDYWTAPGEDYPYGYDSYGETGAGGSDGWAESGDADGSSGSSGSSEGEEGDDSLNIKYDSTEHEGGYWTSAGCFPPTPETPTDTGPGGYDPSDTDEDSDGSWSTASDIATVPCTGAEAPADLYVIDGVEVEMVPFNAGTSALFIPVHAPNRVPTMVNFY